MTRAGRIFALPLMLLALWLQAGAAVASARAIETSPLPALNDAAGDPFAAIPICSPDTPKGSGEPGRQTPAGQHGANHCGVCLVSAVAHPPPLATADVVYPEGLKAAAVPALARHVQPRGPPLHRPHARGPPATA